MQDPAGDMGDGARRFSMVEDPGNKNKCFPSLGEVWAYISSYVTVLKWARRYSFRKQFLRDVIAGLTVVERGALLSLRVVVFFYFCVVIVSDRLVHSGHPGRNGYPAVHVLCDRCRHNPQPAFAPSAYCAVDETHACSRSLCHHPHGRAPGLPPKYGLFNAFIGPFLCQCSMLPPDPVRTAFRARSRPQASSPMHSSAPPRISSRGPQQVQLPLPATLIITQTLFMVLFLPGQ